jgi:hypothetical protein
MGQINYLYTWFEKIIFPDFAQYQCLSYLLIEMSCSVLFSVQLGYIRKRA